MSTTIVTPVTPSITTQKVDAIAEYQALLEGLDSLLPGIDPFVLGGQTISRADLKARLQSRIDAALKVKSTRKALAALVADERGAAAAADPLRSLLKAFCGARFGATSPILQQLGFVQRRRRKTRPAKQAEGAAKAKKTLQTVGPTGRQQRAAAHLERSSGAIEPSGTVGGGTSML
jgi:hypothetical protein